MTAGFLRKIAQGGGLSLVKLVHRLGQAQPTMAMLLTSSALVIILGKF